MTFFYPKTNGRLLVMTENVTLDYPNSADVTNTSVRDITDIQATVDNLKIFLPDATNTIEYITLSFNNVGSKDVDLFLHDQLTIQDTIAVGEFKTYYMYDNITSNGIWREVPAVSGFNGISTLNLNSSDSSINIIDGNVTNPGGTVDFKLNPINATISALANVAPGIVVIDPLAPSPWSVRSIVGDDNIDIFNANGKDGNPTISLVDDISAVTAAIGGVDIYNEVVTTNQSDIPLNLVSNGANSHINLNGITISASSNISGIVDLSIEGQFSAPNVAKATCRFTNTTGTIALEKAFNVSSVTFNPTNFEYTINFENPMSDLNYIVAVHPSNISQIPMQVRDGNDVIRQLGSATIVLYDAGGEMLADIQEGVGVVIYS